MSLGSAAGPNTPYHDVTSKPRSPLSSTVGVCGNSGERDIPVTAITRSRPDFT